MVKYTESKRIPVMITQNRGKEERDISNLQKLRRAVKNITITHGQRQKQREELQQSITDARRKVECNPSRSYIYTVSRCSTRGASEDYTGEKACKKGSTLAWKPWPDVTRSPKEGYQWPHERTYVVHYFRKKEVISTEFMALIGIVYYENCKEDNSPLNMRILRLDRDYFKFKTLCGIIERNALNYLIACTSLKIILTLSNELKIPGYWEVKYSRNTIMYIGFHTAFSALVIWLV